MIPSALILMNKRRTNDYIRLLRALISEARKHFISLNPKSCMFDFLIFDF